MPNFTVGYPRKTGDMKKDIENLNEWALSLIDELNYILANLDECNISEEYTNSLKETEEAVS